MLHIKEQNLDLKQFISVDTKTFEINLVSNEPINGKMDWIYKVILK